jgi:DNA repair protein RadC
LKEKTSKTFKNYTMKVEKSKEMPEIRLKYVSTTAEKTIIRWSEDAYKVLLSLFNPDTIEYMEEAVVLFLTKANNTIGWARISSGGTSSTIIDPKVVFTMALNCGASYFILGHNHPSGKLEPSNEDMSITKELRMAGKLLRLDLIDHLIVTPQGFYSFADKGALY